MPLPSATFLGHQRLVMSCLTQYPILHTWFAIPIGMDRMTAATILPHLRLLWTPHKLWPLTYQVTPFRQASKSSTKPKKTPSPSACIATGQIPLLFCLLWSCAHSKREPTNSRFWWMEVSWLFFFESTTAELWVKSQGTNWLHKSVQITMVRWMLWVETYWLSWCLEIGLLCLLYYLVA